MKPSASRSLERQAVQFMLAECATQLYISRLMLLHIAYKAEKGLDLRQENGIAKVYLANMVHHVVDTAIQLHGSLGYSLDTPLARWYTHIRSQRLVDGPDEVHRWTTGRNVIKAFKDHRLHGERRGRGFAVTAIHMRRDPHFPLPLWERVARTREASFVTGEGLAQRARVPADRDPSSGASRHLLPQGEKGRSARRTRRPGMTGVDSAAPSPAPAPASRCRCGGNPPASRYGRWRYRPGREPPAASLSPGAQTFSTRPTPGAIRASPSPRLRVGMEHGDVRPEVDLSCAVEMIVPWAKPKAKAG